jgi:hypothetical protein
MLKDWIRFILVWGLLVMASPVNATIIFSDYFTDNSYNKWTLTSGVASAENGKLIMSNTACANYGVNCASTLRYYPDSISNFDFSWDYNNTNINEFVSIKLVGGSSWHNWGYESGYAYYFYSDASGYDDIITPSILGLHSYLLVVRDSNVTFYIDGGIKSDRVNAAPFAVTQIRLETIGYPNSTSTFDNIILDDGFASTPTPSSTSTPTPEPIVHTTDSEIQGYFFNYLFAGICLYILTFFVTVFDKR